jgi:tRNA-binding EMAP/Myf-like protein
VQHPDADRLRVCKVDVGQGRHQSALCHGWSGIASW